jgi:hypothetical protein
MAFDDFQTLTDARLNTGILKGTQALTHQPPRRQSLLPPWERSFLNVINRHFGREGVDFPIDPWAVLFRSFPLPSLLTATKSC